MNISLEKNEIEFVMNVLGELPTKSGAFVLLQKIAAQVQMQATSEDIKSE
jgi:hypothetical protein